MKRQRNYAIDRSKIAQQAKPLGELIVNAVHAKMAGLADPLAAAVPPVPKVEAKQRRAKTEREAPVVRACLLWLYQRGIFAWRNNSGTLWANGQPVSFGYPGSSDIIGVMPDGRILCVECKRPVGGRQSGKQIEFQRKIETNGGMYLLVRSVKELECGIQAHLSSGSTTPITTSSIRNSANS